MLQDITPKIEIYTFMERSPYIATNMIVPPFQKLPIELLEPIFGNLEKTDLIAVSLTCKSFVDTVTQVLFSSVSIDIYLDAVTQFSEAIPTRTTTPGMMDARLLNLLCESDHHAKLIRSLRLCADPCGHANAVITAFKSPKRSRNPFQQPKLVRKLFNSLDKERLRHITTDFLYLPDLRQFPQVESLVLRLGTWQNYLFWKAKLCERGRNPGVPMLKLKSLVFAWARPPERLGKLPHRILGLICQMILDAPHLERLEINCRFAEDSDDDSDDNSDANCLEYFRVIPVAESDFAPIQKLMSEGIGTYIKHLRVQFPVQMYRTSAVIMRKGKRMHRYTWFQIWQEILSRRNEALKSFEWFGLPHDDWKGNGIHETLPVIKNLEKLDLEFLVHAIEDWKLSGGLEYLDRTSFANENTLRSLTLHNIPLDFDWNNDRWIGEFLIRFAVLEDLVFEKSRSAKSTEAFKCLFEPENVDELAMILPKTLRSLKISISREEFEGVKSFYQTIRNFRKLFHYCLSLRTFIYENDACETHCYDYEPEEERGYPSCRQLLEFDRRPLNTHITGLSRKRLEMRHIELASRVLDQTSLQNERRPLVLHTFSWYMLPDYNYQGPDSRGRDHEWETRRVDEKFQIP